MRRNRQLSESRESPRPVTVEDVATIPAPGLSIPGDFAFSPDDRLLTYLASPDASLSRQLYALDLSTGETSVLVESAEHAVSEEGLSLAEQLLRERQRQLATGITRYAWAKEAPLILLPLSDGLYVLDVPTCELRQIVSTGSAPMLDPKLSPDARWLSYVQEREIAVVPIDGGEPRFVTQGALAAELSHGLAEYIAQEEMGRRTGYWWSPDSRWIAFAEVDERHVPIYRILHQGKDTVGPAAQEEHRYPFAGQANASVRLAVTPLGEYQPRWLEPPGNLAAEYLARVDWLDASTVVAQWENREQSRLDLVAYEIHSGESTTLLSETNEIWINLHDDFRALAGGQEFLWSSERSGFRQLYHYDRSGQLIRQITSGDWQVDALVAVDENRRLVYFTSTLKGATEAHVFAVSLDGGPVRPITVDGGVHQAVFDHHVEKFVDIYQAIDHPPDVTLHSLTGPDPVQVIFEPADPRLAELALEPPELVSVTNRVGDVLHGAVFRPPARFGPGPYPTVVNLYGGPHAQLVTNSWRTSVNLRAQLLCSLGYLVFVLDNRGSARRGLEFESAIRGRTGRAEVEDQVDGVRWLVAQGLTDGRRVGVYGWSYGGYLAAMCLATAPETFKLAVAGAPVTHWDGYDTHYTERYVGTPETNPLGYRDSSVFAHVQSMTGNLLVVHGLIDENVHFRHTARLVNALIRARKPYELLLFPDERHTPRKQEDRIYLEERVRDFIVENL
jgi:dipeptidyl-peptidase-4